MDPFLQFLKKFSYNKVETATPQTLLAYLAQLEKLSSGLKDPTVTHLVKSLKSTPINRISQQLSLIEKHLISQQVQKQSRISNGKTNSKQPVKANQQTNRIIIYKDKLS